MHKIIKSIRKVLHSAGLDIVKYPPADWEWAGSRFILARTLQQLAIDCVLDVGANRGQYGRQLRDLGFRGQILSFEPVRDNFNALEECAAKLGPWKCFNFALGAVAGDAEIHVTEEDVFSSFLQPMEESLERFPSSRVTRVETVQVRRLDAVLEECAAGVPGSRLYLKLDTQGFDLQVLAGASGVMDKILALQTEISFRPIYHGSPGYEDSLRAFQAQGFGVVDFMPVVRDSAGLCAVEMDCVMARSLH